MKIATRKAIAWYLLGGGASSTLFFIFLCALLGFPEIRAAIWPCVSIALSVWAIFQLKYCYKIEPAPQTGWWHLSLADLMLGTLGTGAMLALTQATMNEKDFLRAGIALSFVAGIMLVSGNLIACSQGIVQLKYRMLFSLSFWMKVFGSMGILTFTLLILIVIVTRPSDLPRLLQDVISSSREKALFLPIQLGFILLPIGIGLGTLVPVPSAPPQQPPLS